MLLFPDLPCVQHLTVFIIDPMFEVNVQDRINFVFTIIDSRLSSLLIAAVLKPQSPRKSFLGALCFFEQVDAAEWLAYVLGSQIVQLLETRNERKE